MITDLKVLFKLTDTAPLLLSLNSQSWGLGWDVCWENMQVILGPLVSFGYLNVKYQILTITSIPIVL
jgi:hypothetical protein